MIVFFFQKTESPRIRLYGLTTLKNAMGKMVFPKLPLHKQLYYLWNAPITKFWVNQVRDCKQTQVTD